MHSTGFMAVGLGYLVSVPYTEYRIPNTGISYTVYRKPCTERIMFVVYGSTVPPLKVRLYRIVSTLQPTHPDPCGSVMKLLEFKEQLSELQPKFKISSCNSRVVFSII